MLILKYPVVVVVTVLGRFDSGYLAYMLTLQLYLHIDKNDKERIYARERTSKGF